MFNSFKKNLAISAIFLAFLGTNFAYSNEIKDLTIPVIDTPPEESPKTDETTESEEPVETEEIPETQDFQNKIVRVLLSNNGNSKQKEFIITSQDEIFITVDNNLIANTTMPVKIQKNGEYIIVQTQNTIQKIPVNKKILLQTKDSLLRINNFSKKNSIATYKGSIEISAKDSYLRAINIIDIEDYIKGVVPNEMPVSFGLEALKAQAIAARGYVYRDRKLKSNDFDVCDTVGSQVYNGANSYDPISDKAADETKGQFATYNGKIILSLYSSTAGGHTESYENAFSLNGIDIKFPSDPIPYLKGVPDRDFELDLSTEKDARDFYMKKPDSFDINSTKYRWEYAWTKKDLTNILIKNLMKFSKSPFVQPALKSENDFGEIKNIDIPKRGVSGKAMYVRITTDKATFLIAKEIMIRQIFTYNNKWLPSANFVIERYENNNNNILGFKFYGGGFGHGVGLSQYGASGMAKKGFKYDEILKHYYNGISVSSYPVECNLKEPKNCKATFYSNNKNGNLILQFNQKPQDITFRINDHDVRVSLNKMTKTEGKAELKKWLKKGINTIELVDYTQGFLDFSNPTVNFYVELGNKNEK